jgi:hypothetical protein
MNIDELDYVILHEGPGIFFARRRRSAVQMRLLVCGFFACCSLFALWLGVMLLVHARDGAFGPGRQVGLGLTAGGALVGSAAVWICRNAWRENRRLKRSHARDLPGVLVADLDARRLTDGVGVALAPLDHVRVGFGTDPATMALLMASAALGGGSSSIKAVTLYWPKGHVVVYEGAGLRAQQVMQDLLAAGLTGAG